MTDSFVEVETQSLSMEEGRSTSTAAAAPKVFWKLEYYQQFFNVTTSDVGHRILSSMIPNRKGFIDVISSNPDLFGPLWVCVTLIVTASMSGNIAKYFGSEGQSVWTFQFQEVTSLATILFIYTWIVPILLWGVLIWRVGQANTHSLLSMITLYGYSLSIYIPVSILWTVLIRFITVQWVLTMTAAALSGGVLAISFWPVIKRDRQKIAYGVIGAILLLHILLAVGFQLYFFRSVSSSPLPTQLQLSKHTLPEGSDMRHPGGIPVQHELPKSNERNPERNPDNEDDDKDDFDIGRTENEREPPQIIINLDDQPDEEVEPVIINGKPPNPKETGNKDTVVVKEKFPPHN